MNHEPYKNKFFRVKLTNDSATTGGLFSLEVTNQNPFFPKRNVYYPPKPSPNSPPLEQWVYWDGRNPAGQILEGSIPFWVHDSKIPSVTTVAVLGTSVEVTGPGGVPAPGEAPDIEVKSDPYLVTHSYEQLSRMTYRVNHNSRVRFVLLPPGIVDPGHPTARVLVDNELVAANTNETVEWRGYDTQFPGRVLVSQDGPYTFAIEARSLQSNLTTVYRGVLNLYQ